MKSPSHQVTNMMIRKNTPFSIKRKHLGCHLSKQDCGVALFPFQRPSYHPYCGVLLFPFMKRPSYHPDCWFPLSDPHKHPVGHLRKTEWSDLGRLPTWIKERLGGRRAHWQGIGVIVAHPIAFSISLEQVGQASVNDFSPRLIYTIRDLTFWLKFSSYILYKS